MPEKAVAEKFGVELSEYLDYERSGIELNITDATRLAKIFYTHWSVFLNHNALPDVKSLKSHRKPTDVGQGEESGATIRAYELANRVLDLSESLNGPKISADLQTLALLKGEASSQQTAKLFRKLISPPKAEPKKPLTPSKALQHWSAEIEKLGIYVTSQEMPYEETKAFIIIRKDSAVITINRKDKYVESRMFSLLHEVGHYIYSNSSSACDTDVIYKFDKDKEEAWCNNFASYVLLPAGALNELELTTPVNDRETADRLIRRIKNKYKVSYSVTLYRFKKEKLLTDNAFKEIKKHFQTVILPNIFKPPKKSETTEMKLPRKYYVANDLSRNGAMLTREVLTLYRQGKISQGELPTYLNTKSAYVEQMKEMVGFGN